VSSGCGPSCEKNHQRDGSCLVCGFSFGRPYHKNHSCQAAHHLGKRGMWKQGGGRSKKRELSLSAEDFFRQLTSGEEAFAKEHGALPSSRCALYGGNGNVAHEMRKALWDLGVCVRESPGDISNWVDSIAAWPSPDDEVLEAAGKEGDGKDGLGELASEFDEPPPNAPTLGRQASAGDMRLEYCRKRLAAVEAEQAKLEQLDDDNRKGLAAKGQALFAKLSASVDARRDELDRTLGEVRAALAASGQASAVEGVGGKQAATGARSGRDAALAEAWWAGLKAAEMASRGAAVSKLDGARLVRRGVRAVRWLEAEKESLRQVTLAGKVVSLIPSPEQIKYLNLTHDWLRTYLPVRTKRHTYTRAPLGRAESSGA